MRFFTLFIVFFWSISGIYSQNTTCKTFWDGEAGDGQFYMGGTIDHIHAIRMFLCQKGNKLKGYYEMISSKKMVDVEGFIKGDSIFLAEYSSNQKVLGMIKGYLQDSAYVADLSSPAGVYTGSISVKMYKNWALCKQDINSQYAKIILYESDANPSQQMLISYPNDYACRGILNDDNQHKTFYMSGRKPENKEKQYKITTLSYPISAGKITCSLKGEEFVQSTLPGIRTNMKATITIPLYFIEKTDRMSAYEIHYPYTKNKKADLAIENIVSKIKHDFDSMYSSTSGLYKEEEQFGRVNNMIAWFEPSYVSKKWICGHFIVHNSALNESQIIPYNYNYKWNKVVVLSDLIQIEKGKDLNWNKVMAEEKGEALDSSITQNFDSPAIAFHGLLLTTNYDRLYDRALYQTKSKIKGLKWKWWKFNYWLFKSQQI